MTHSTPRSKLDSDIRMRLGSLLERSFQLSQGDLVDAVELSTLGIDSLALVELANAVEHEFGIVVDDRAVETIRTFGDLVAHVSHSLAADADAQA